MEPSDLILEVAALREDRAADSGRYLRLDLNRLLGDWEQISRGVAFAVEFLEEEHIFDGDRLPNVAVVRILAALHEHLPNSTSSAMLATSYANSCGERSSPIATKPPRRPHRSKTFALCAAFCRAKAPREAVPLFDEERYPLPGPEELIQARWPKTRDSLGRAILMSRFAPGRMISPTTQSLPAIRFESVSTTTYFRGPAGERGKSMRARSTGTNCALITWNTNRTISAKEPVRYLRERVETSRPRAERDKVSATHYVPFAALAVGGYDNIPDTETRAGRVQRLRSVHHCESGIASRADQGPL